MVAAPKQQKTEIFGCASLTRLIAEQSESVSALGLIDQALLHQGKPEIDENARFV